SNNEDRTENSGFNNCSDSEGKRIAHGACMAMNPAGTLIADAIRSSKHSNRIKTTYSTDDDEF
ncbi:unnamed protein product, partial [Adineta steineri]